MIDSDQKIVQKLGCYWLYGIHLYSDYPFSGHLLLESSEVNSVDLVFAYNSLPPFLATWQEQEKVYTSPYLTVDGKNLASFYRFGDCLAIRFFDALDYYLRAERIDCYLHQHFQYLDIEDFFWGPVLALWLERRGTPVLHASAISINGQATAFLAKSGGGKSTLAAAFLRNGQALLTDDILPLEEIQECYWGHSGLPQINLWPQQIDYLAGLTPKLEPSSTPPLSKRRVPIGSNGFGTFCSQSQPLGCIYLPQRIHPAVEGVKIEITPLGPAEAVFALAGFSFMANVVQNLGWQERRLDFFARLIQQVPVRRICYPDGFENLDRVTDAILEDLKKLPRVSGPAG